MDDLIYYLFDMLKGVDSLIGVFIVAIFAVIFTPIKKLSEKGKMTIIKLLVIGLCLSIINSTAIRMIDAYSQTKGLK